MNRPGYVEDPFMLKRTRKGNRADEGPLSSSFMAKRRKTKVVASNLLIIH